MIIIVNEPLLRSFLNTSNIVKDNIVIVSNSRGELISSSTNLKEYGISYDQIKSSVEKTADLKNRIIEINRSKFVFSSTYSEASSLSYIILFPVKVIQSKVNLYSKYILISIVLFFSLGIVLVLIVSREIYLPIRRLIRLFSGIGRTGNACKNEFDLIYENISNINRENLKMKNTLEEHKKLVEEMNLNKLLNGISSLSENETITKLADAYPAYLTMILHVENTDSGKISSSICTELGSKLCNAGLLYKCLTMTNRESLFVIKVENREHCIETLKMCFYAIQPADDVFIIGGVSDIHNNIIELKEAYLESIKAINYRSTSDEGVRLIFPCDLMEIHNGDIKLTFNDEKILANNVLNGNEYEVEKFFYENKVLNNHCAFFIMKDMYIYLISVLSIITNSKSIVFDEIIGYSRDSLVSEIEDSYNIQMIKSKVANAYLKVTRYIKDCSRDIDSYIIDFVRRNYDKDIYLDMLAERFGRTSSYISTYFKKITGMNYLAYVNMLRIEKAKEILETTNMTIADISTKVGFNDITTFIRLFKKYEGVTPGLYRMNLKKYKS